MPRSSHRAIRLSTTEIACSGRFRESERFCTLFSVELHLAEGNGRERFPCSISNAHGELPIGIDVLPAHERIEICFDKKSRLRRGISDGW